MTFLCFGIESLSGVLSVCVLCIPRNPIFAPKIEKKHLDLPIQILETNQDERSENKPPQNLHHPQGGNSLYEVCHSTICGGLWARSVFNVHQTSLLNTAGFKPMTSQSRFAIDHLPN